VPNELVLKKVALQFEMERNAIKSEFQKSKMAANSCWDQDKDIWVISGVTGIFR
jgi:hypothetical protein